MQGIRSVLCISLFLLSPFLGISQLIPDSLGMDDNPLLSDMEARYFNIQVQHYRDEFDFRGTQLGLFMENNGKHMVNKKEYFDNCSVNTFCTYAFTSGGARYIPSVRSTMSHLSTKRVFVRTQKPF